MENLRDGQQRMYYDRKFERDNTMKMGPIVDLDSHRESHDAELKA